MVILEGHVQDFYDFNKLANGGSDYLPVLYFILAIWNLPLVLFGAVESLYGFPQAFKHIDPLAVLWAKSLMVVFFAFSVRQVYKIGYVFSGNEKNSGLLALAFATAPIALFSVFVLGQYDVIGLAFALTGYLYYVKRDEFRFLLYFSLAISFKYFALVIFVPLLLLSEKRLFALALKFTVAIFPTLLQAAAYWSNSAFRESFLALPLRKLQGGDGDVGLAFWWQASLIFTYALLCGWAYWKKADSPREINFHSLVIVLLSYLLMFWAVSWHPQWLIIMTPFSALAIYFVKRRGLFLLSEAIGMVLFCFVVVSRWPANVDSSMLLNGVLGGLFSTKRLLLSDVVPYSPFIYFMASVFISAPVVFMLFSRRPTSISREAEGVNGLEYALKLRFASLLVFVIPAVLIALVPERAALRFNSDAFLRGMRSYPVHPRAVYPVGEICCGRTIVQSFTANDDNLAAIGFLTATYGRSNTSLLVVKILDDQGNLIVVREFPAQSVKDNKELVIKFEPFPEAKGREFSVSVSSPDAVSGNALTVWASREDLIEKGVLSFGGEVAQGDLVITSYYMRRDNPVKGSGLLF